MRGITISLAACCLMAASCGMDLPDTQRFFLGTPTIIMATAHQIDRKEVISNSYIVAFRTELPRGGLQFSSYRSEYRAHYAMLQSMMQSADDIDDMHYILAMDLTGTRPVKSKSVFRSPLEKRLYGEKDDADIKGASITRVDFRSHRAAEATLKKWMREGRIWYAEPNYVSRTADNVFTGHAATYTTMEETVSWYTQIKLAEAFTHMASQDVDMSRVPIIAVMDSGTDYKHEALVNNIWQNSDGTVGKAGCKNDWYGCNTTQADKGSLGNGDVWPTGTNAAGESCDPKVKACPHGTHVAGLVAAEPRSEYGGVCPVCKIMTVRVVGRTKSKEGKDENTIADSSLIAGFAYISKFTSFDSNAVRVVNASFGKSQRSRTVQLLIRLLKAQGRGTLVIAAAGNEDTMLRQYPAAYEDVIAVANVYADTNIKHPSSNFGSWVDIAAPGSSNAGGLLSSVPGNGEMRETGTSMSTPVVAGAAGLLLVQKPDLSMDKLREILLGSSDAALYTDPQNQPYIQKVKGSSDPVPLLGVGILNVENAVKRIMPEHIPTPVFARVSPSCGTLAVQGRVSCLLSFILLCLPLIALGRIKRAG